jgi:hypothetical protein
MSARTLSFSEDDVLMDLSSCCRFLGILPQESLGFYRLCDKEKMQSGSFHFFLIAARTASKSPWGSKAVKLSHLLKTELITIIRLPLETVFCVDL